MKWLAVTVLGWVLVPLLALAQENVELNAITSVKVNGTTVEITGSKKPNFTTFTMTDPPRLVIDISEAILNGVPEELRVKNELVTGLRSANYGTDSSAIARVLIGYDREVETDIQVSGNTLVVKVLDGSSPAVAQGSSGTEQPVQVAMGPTATEQQDRGTQEKGVVDAAAASKAEREAQLKAEAEAAALAKKQEEERRKAEEAARAEAAKKAEDERRARELAAAEEKKHQQEIARAAAEEKKQAEADERKRKAEEAEQKRLAALDEKKRKAEEAEQKRLAALDEQKRKAEEARAEAEAKKQAEADEKKRRAEEAEQKRLAALDERKHKAEEAREAAEEKKQAEADEKKRRAEEAEQKRLAALDEKKRKAEQEARATRVASAEVPRRAEPESTPPAGPVSGRHKTLEIVGFQQQGGASRVFVRTNEPVSYKVSEGRNEIVLMLENTQIGKGNNTRALDTSFFDTAVARVDPTIGPDRTVRVSIKLKEQVPVQTHQEGNTISLEFPRPGR